MEKIVKNKDVAVHLEAPADGHEDDEKVKKDEWSCS